MSIRVEPLPEPSAPDPDWDALLDRSAASSVFLSRAWVETWWPVFGPRFTWRGLAARDEAGRLVGVAPFVVGPGPGRLRGRLRHLMLLGQRADTLAEHLDLLVERGREADVVPALVRAAIAEAGHRFDVLLLERVRADSPVLPHLERTLVEAGLDPRRTGAQRSPYVRLPETYERLLASRGRSLRQQVRRAERDLAARGPVEVLRAGEDIGLDDAMDVLVRLHRRRFGEGRGSFRTGDYLRFHRALAPRLLAEDALLLLVLRSNGEDVAARYDFLHGGRVWCFQGGWDPAFGALRPGTLATAATLRWGIEHGYAEYDFLSGEDAYKDRWADDARTLVNVEAYVPTLRSRLYRLVRPSRAP